MKIAKQIFRKFKKLFFPPSKLPPFNFRLVDLKTDQFKHSGNLGDIIFSCILLKSFWEETGKQAKLHLQTDVRFEYDVEHPMKNVLMNKKVANQLVPALLKQPYIAQVTLGETPPLDAINLDQFRKLPIDHRTGLIPGWYQLCTDTWLNVFEPWIYGDKLAEFSNKILVSRTQRLRSPYIDYQFLAKYRDDLLFVGLPDECSLFRNETGIDCEYVTMTDFETLINMIHSCRLFIGNQGFLSSIAESVKCPRLLESNLLAPNNFPLSSNGRMAIFQEQFERQAESLLNL